MAGEIVAVARVKQQLKIEADDTSQDDQVTLLRDAAFGTIKAHVDRIADADWPVDGTTESTRVAMATLLLVEAWWINGQATDGLPAAVLALLAPLRVMSA